MIIGNRYFLDNPESGLYEVTKEAYEQHHAFWERLRSKYIKPGAETIGRFVLMSMRPLGDDDHEDFRQLWMDSAEKSDNPHYKYFQPVWEDSKFDKYGHAILPTGVREITNDAISTARLQFPKNEDEAFGDT